MSKCLSDHFSCKNADFEFLTGVALVRIYGFTSIERGRLAD